MLVHAVYLGYLNVKYLSTNLFDVGTNAGAHQTLQWRQFQCLDNHFL